MGRPVGRNKKDLIAGRPSATECRDALARAKNKRHLDVEVNNQPAADHAGKLDQVRTDDRDDRFQLQFLKDPLNLAKAVLARLRGHDVEGALNLVRLSDREKVENIVSWNHLMDYEMSFENPKGALKVYNEVSRAFGETPIVSRPPS